jgi:hypothetical protein
MPNVCPENGVQTLLETVEAKLRGYWKMPLSYRKTHRQCLKGTGCTLGNGQMILNTPEGGGGISQLVSKGFHWWYDAEKKRDQPIENRKSLDTFRRLTK